MLIFMSLRSGMNVYWAGGAYCCARASASVVPTALSAVTRRTANYVPPQLHLHQLLGERQCRVLLEADVGCQRRSANDVARIVAGELLQANRDVASR